MRITIGLLLVLVFTITNLAQKNKAAAENFSAVAMNGQTFELKALRGKVVVLTFWSTRCPICHHEIPKLNQIARQYKGKEVVFLGLTMENSNKIEAYLKNNSFAFNILPDSFGVVLQYADKGGKGNINMGFPAHFLINKNGEIEFKTSGFDKTEQLNAGISRLLTAK